MKNHKCASSTIENIIFRYKIISNYFKLNELEILPFDSCRFAYKNHLNVVLPPLGNYLSKLELFNHKSLEAAKWKDVSFDIFSLHNRWNRKEVMTLLKEEVPTFTIIRDPVDVFVSMFHYQMKLGEFYGVVDIHDMVRMIQHTPSLPVLSQRWLGFIGRNQIGWDLGLSPDIFDDPTAIGKEIERLDHEFDLVMLANRMDESLILLMHLLNWPLEYLLHLDLNRRKPERATQLTLDERAVLGRWLAADVQIFEYFSRRFDERVSKLNTDKERLGYTVGIPHESYVEKQMVLLKEANRQLYNTCVLEEVGNEKLTGKFKETNDNIIGYLINE